MFSQHSGLYPHGITPHALHTLLQQRSGINEPLPGLNLSEYFSKRHLVDLPPIEPLPPIENPLEMTQNHEDWVRGREDFKIEHEKMQTLQDLESF